MDAIFNFRLTKTFRLVNAWNLEFLFDVFNVLNKYNPIAYNKSPYDIYSISGESSFGKPAAISLPRRVLFGIRFKF